MVWARLPVIVAARLPVPTRTRHLMNPTDTQSAQDPSAPTAAAPRTRNEAGDRSAENRGPAARIKPAAGRAVDRAKETAARAATAGKETAAGKLGGYSDELRATAQAAQEDDPNIAHFVNSAADRLQQAADYVRGADLPRLRRDAADVAHRHPALFMGGMFAAGLVFGNLAKASAQTIREDATDGEDDDEGRYTADSPAESGEMPGGVSDSFDPAPRGGEPEPSL